MNDLVRHGDSGQECTAAPELMDYPAPLPEVYRVRRGQGLVSAIHGGAEHGGMVPGRALSAVSDDVGKIHAHQANARKCSSRN